MKELIDLLYKTSRKIGKLGSILNDIDVLSTGDPKKIVKRAIRKTVYKASNQAAKKVNSKIK